MSNGEQSYNLRQIRQLLNTAFDDVELDALCLDYFPTVYDNFSRGMRKDSKITFLLDHCRRDVTNLEKLFTLIQAENKEAFTPFESTVKVEINEPLLVSNSVKLDLSPLFAELTEWKQIHNDVQEALNQFRFTFDYLTSYRFKLDFFLLEQSIFAWKELYVDQLKTIPSKWNLQYADNPSLSTLQAKCLEIDEMTEKLIADLNEVSFNYLYMRFRELRVILWRILTAADKRIMVLIEDIQSKIGA